MSLTKEEVKKIASLAKLSFTDEELDKFIQQFNSILDYIRLIDDCDTEGIEDTHNLEDYSDEVLQEDIAQLGLSRDAALMNAVDRVVYGYIKTSQIVSKE